MMLRQQRLEYPDHNEEIATLNRVLEVIQKSYPDGHPAELEPAVKVMLKRLDDLMTTAKAVLKDFNPREQYL